MSAAEDDVPEACCEEASEDECDPRPIIKLPAELHDTVDAGIVALATNENVYQRDGGLVHVIRIPEDEGQASLLAGTPVIRELHTPALAAELARVARWWKSTRKGWAECYPDSTVVAAIAACGQYRGVRPLTGITESPTLRPDGTISGSP